MNGHDPQPVLFRKATVLLLTAAVSILFLFVISPGNEARGCYCSISPDLL